MLNNLKIFTILFMCMLATSCSVYKAASNEGLSISDIAKCNTEGCLLSYGMEIVSSHELDDDKLQVLYRGKARKSGVSYVRAAGHGLLDVATFGLWEVAGTPIEGALSENRGFVTAKATYLEGKRDGFESIQIYDVYGKVVVDKKIPQ